jgi:rhodanese-related sulfurtransferase
VRRFIIVILMILPVTVAAQNSGAPRFGIPPDENNYADESTDWQIPQEKGLTSQTGKTPIAVPGATTITTRQLAEEIAQNEKKMVLIDAWANPAHQTVSGARRLWFSGYTGSFDDPNQSALYSVLQYLIGGDLNYRIVVFCYSSQCWESYNATLRVVALGYKNIGWYRGGMLSWTTAKMPVTTDYGLEVYVQ